MNRRVHALGTIATVLSRIRLIRTWAFGSSMLEELIPHTAAPQRALEVGCGSGFLLSQLRSCGYEAEGVEWDPLAAECAQRFSGAPIAVGDFRHMTLSLAAYDLIVLHHVFEHLDDPVGAVLRIGQLLRPSGRAVLIYPNAQSLGSRRFGWFWSPWDPPRHLVFPSMGALRRLAEDAGLRVQRIRTTARTAPRVWADSAAYRRGYLGESRGMHRALSCRLAGWLESLLIGGGIPVGEEVIAVLGKPASSPAHVPARQRPE